MPHHVILCLVACVCTYIWQVALIMKASCFKNLRQVALKIKASSLKKVLWFSREFNTFFARQKVPLQLVLL